jgi:hypothetical protein
MQSLILFTTLPVMRNDAKDMRTDARRNKKMRCQMKPEVVKSYIYPIVFAFIRLALANTIL